MWLQRVLSNVQVRLFGREERSNEANRSSRPSWYTRERERVQIFQARLLDLDRRLAQLR